MEPGSEEPGDGFVENALRPVNAASMSRAPKSPVTALLGLGTYASLPASMEPGSEEPGDANAWICPASMRQERFNGAGSEEPGDPSRRRWDGGQGTSASMEPGSEEPGDPLAPGDDCIFCGASMEPGSEEPGDCPDSCSRKTSPRGCFNGAGLRRAR